MNQTQLTYEQLQMQMLKENISQLVEWLIPEMERQGYTVTKPKRYLTTKEMCEEAGIKYNSWKQSEVRNDQRIIEMRDRDSGQAIQYRKSDVDEIKEIWREYHRKKKRGEQ